MVEFLEELLPARIKSGPAVTRAYATESSETAGGQRYVRLRHPYQRLSIDLGYADLSPTVVAGILAFYDRACGGFRGFRVRDPDDCSSNAYTVTQTALDQPAIRIAAGQYQLVRWYGDPELPTVGRRVVRKPVAGSVLVAVDGVPTASGWTVDTTTGVLTFEVDPGPSAVVTAGFLFDIPCRFDAEYQHIRVGGLRTVSGLTVSEIIGP